MTRTSSSRLRKVILPSWLLLGDTVVAFARGPDEGADAAEEQEVGARLEDGAEHVVRRGALAGKVEERPHLGG